jgi:hypothetical protein
MRTRTIAIALGALLATTTLAAVPAMAQADYNSYTYSYTTTYPGTTYYTPPTGLGGVGVYVRPGPYVPPPATPDPSFVPSVPPSTAYVPGTTSTTTTYVTPAPTTTYVAPSGTYYVAPGSTTTIYTTR